MEKNKILLELRIGEGGDDAKLLIKDMRDIFLKFCKNSLFETKIKEEKEGLISI
jgi:protein subunit release factor A